MRSDNETVDRRSHQADVAFLFSLVGLFDSGCEDASERVEMLVEEFILMRQIAIEQT